jgi:hypothetical protein
MKNVLLTALLIAAAVASGDLLAQATSPKMPASRAAAAVADDASLGVSDGNRGRARHRVTIAWVGAGKTTAE